MAETSSWSVFKRCCGGWKNCIFCSLVKHFLHLTGSGDGAGLRGGARWTAHIFFWRGVVFWYYLAPAAFWRVIFDWRYCDAYFCECIVCDIICRTGSFLSVGDALLSVGGILLPVGDILLSFGGNGASSRDFLFAICYCRAAPFCYRLAKCCCRLVKWDRLFVTCYGLPALLWCRATITQNVGVYCHKWAENNMFAADGNVPAPTDINMSQTGSNDMSQDCPVP